MSESNIDVTEMHGDISLSAEQKAQVQALVRQIMPQHPHALTHYGTEVQDKLARVADSMLHHIRTQEVADHIGNLLKHLMEKLRDVQPDKLFVEKRGFLARLLGSSFEKTRVKLLSQYQKTNHEIERMADTLERMRHQMLRDLTMLDVLHQKNKEYFYELTVYIAAAREKLQELKIYALPELQEKMQASGNDPLRAQDVTDMMRFIDRLEKKLQDLMISQTMALQTATQIRLIQENGQMLMEKIRSSILTAIPLWKSQVVILLTLVRQQKTLATQRKLMRATGTLLERNSELLKSGSHDVLEEQDRAIRELHAFKQMREELLLVLEDTLAIQREGSEKRKRIEQDHANRTGYVFPAAKST
jgi:uncharacterized protein YaaN involved in tellurite resistance